MLNEFLFTKIEEEDIGNIWFQQDGATYHTAEATLNVLRLVFEDRIISSRADVVWTPRTEYFLKFLFLFESTILPVNNGK